MYYGMIEINNLLGIDYSYEQRCLKIFLNMNRPDWPPMFQLVASLTSQAAFADYQINHKVWGQQVCFCPAEVISRYHDEDLLIAIDWFWMDLADEQEVSHEQ